MAYTSKTMLSYPGGKSRAVKLITEHFPKNLTHMVSPFFGGGSIELYMAANGTTVYGSDIFYPLVAFWCEALTNPRPGQAPTAKQLGDALRDHKGRVSGGKKLTPRKIHGDMHWAVEALTRASAP